MARQTRITTSGEPAGPPTGTGPLILTKPVADPAPATPPHETAAPEPAPRAASPASSPRRRRTAGTLSAVLGGVIAAGVGAAAAVYLVPRHLPGLLGAEDAALGARLDDQAEMIAALRAEVSKLAAGPRSGPQADPAQAAALAELGQAVESSRAAAARLAADLQAADAGAVGEMAGLAERLARLEARPPAGNGSQAVAALEAELAGIRTQIEAQKSAATLAAGTIEAAAQDAEARLRATRAEADRLQAETVAAGQKSLGRAALVLIGAALESGASYEAALADLTGTGVAVPAALAEGAGGIASLAELQAAFPPAARAALDAARATEAGTGALDRFQVFLRSQTGARSLEPRDGTDADAVLSRVEAALRAGDLTAATAELDGLSAAGQPALAAWRAEATRRLAALAAAQGLAGELN